MKIVLVGAGGTGMSGIAGLLHDLGYPHIICIDSAQSQLTDQLQKKGLKVIIGHGQYQPQLDDFIIYSQATQDSFEVKSARELSTKHQKIIPIMNYFQFLGEISKYFTTIGFAGTNGKSSSTAIAIYGAHKTLPEFGLGILGSLVPDFDNKSYLTNPTHTQDIKTIFDFILTGKQQSLLHDRQLIKKYYFIVEACEYQRHFLNLDLDYSIITSLELDHTDYYKDFDDYQNAFHTLIHKTKNKVFVPENIKSQLNLNDPHIQYINIKQINFNKIRGDHNHINGSLVNELLTELNKKDNLSHILDFNGLRRRMELIGTNINGAIIYSDYGHMASSLDLGFHSIKARYPDKKILTIFQPHQINRIAIGRDDMIKSLKQYDQAIIYDIYAARESLELLNQIGDFQTINELGISFAQACDGQYIQDFDKLQNIINSIGQDHIIVIYSAGDIDYKIRKHLPTK